jgi:hypothetical protein
VQATPSKSPVGPVQSELLQKLNRDKMDAYIGQLSRKLKYVHN